MDHQNHILQDNEARLDALFQAYREVCPDFEASPDFMLRLWERIEAHQNVAMVFGRLARNLATAALALSCLLGLAVSISGSRAGQLPSESYAEILSEEHNNASLEFEPVRLMAPAESR